MVHSIIIAMKRLGASKITLSNRTKEKAEDLKNYFHGLEIINWGQKTDFDWCPRPKNGFWASERFRAILGQKSKFSIF